MATFVPISVHYDGVTVHDKRLQLVSDGSLVVNGMVLVTLPQWRLHKLMIREARGLREEFVKMDIKNKHDGNISTENVPFLHEGRMKKRARNSMAENSLLDADGMNSLENLQLPHYTESAMIRIVNYGERTRINDICITATPSGFGFGAANYIIESISSEWSIVLVSAACSKTKRHCLPLELSLLSYCDVMLLTELTALPTDGISKLLERLDRYTHTILPLNSTNLAFDVLDIMPMHRRTLFISPIAENVVAHANAWVEYSAARCRERASGGDKPFQYSKLIETERLILCTTFSEALRWMDQPCIVVCPPVPALVKLIVNLIKGIQKKTMMNRTLNVDVCLLDELQHKYCGFEKLSDSPVFRLPQTLRLSQSEAVQLVTCTKPKRCFSTLDLGNALAGVQKLDIGSTVRVDLKEAYEVGSMDSKFMNSVLESVNIQRESLTYVGKATLNVNGNIVIS